LKTGRGGVPKDVDEERRKGQRTGMGNPGLGRKKKKRGYLKRGGGSAQHFAARFTRTPWRRAGQTPLSFASQIQNESTMGEKKGRCGKEKLGQDYKRQDERTPTTGNEGRRRPTKDHLKGNCKKQRREEKAKPIRCSETMCRGRNKD